MSSNPHDERTNVDVPHHQHTAQGQRQWQEAEAHVQTPIFQGARLNHTGVVKHPSKTQGKQYYVVRHFPVLS
jgi:hypothetical protein